MNNDKSVRLPVLVMMTIVAHTTTYLIMGIIASSLLNYADRFARPEMICWMRPVSDPLVMAGPLFQPIRGIIFALVFFPLREILFTRKNGWFIMWWILVALGIISTFGPSPGSIEGMIYTVIPWRDQLAGWLEVIPQAFLLSVVLFYWVRNPMKRWLNWALGAVFIIGMLLPVMGLLFTHYASR